MYGLLPIASVELRRNSKEPLKNQLFSRLKRLILDGRIAEGVALPSTRALAEELSVSRNTVCWAYERLTFEGYISSRPGAVSRVAPVTGQAAAPAAEPARTTCSESLHRETGLAPGTDLRRGSDLVKTQVGASVRMQAPGFRPFYPDVSEFPFTLWQRLIARRFQLWDEPHFGYGNYCGYEPLRQVISDYLRANRSVTCTPGQVIVTNGSQGALDLIARALLRPGDKVWCEEPGYSGALGNFIAAGAHAEPLHVSPGGKWQLDTPPPGPLKLIYVTPSCQQPLCTIMQEDARRQLVDIAEERGAWIVEDDFDNEFRPPSRFVRSVQGIDRRDRTIYIGTFTKTMFPALRLGFMVVPEPLVETLKQLVFISGHFPSLPLQAALFDFIEQGHFSHHIKRMRRIYAQRRAIVAAEIEKTLSDWLTPMPGTVGMQMPVWLPPDCDDQILVKLAYERENLALMPLSVQYHHGAPVSGLVLGYGCMNERKLRTALRKLRSTLERNVPLRGGVRPHA